MARQRAHLMAEAPDNEQWIEQLMTIAGMCDAFHILLETISTEAIDYKTIDSWMSTVYQKGAYTNSIAERGCRTVVDSPAKIASVAEKTIWIGVDGDAVRVRNVHSFIQQRNQNWWIRCICIHGQKMQRITTMSSRC